LIEISQFFEISLKKIVFQKFFYVKLFFFFCYETYLGQSGSICNGRLESVVHRVVHRLKARRSYESVIDVFLNRASCCGCRRRRWCGGGDQFLLLSRVYLYVLITLGLYLRSVTFRTRACPRPRSMPMTGAATGIIVHSAETYVLVLGATGTRLNRGVVMRATA